MNIAFILLHNRHTGVNTWAYTLSKEFIKNGNSVTFKIVADAEPSGYVEQYTKFTDECKLININVVMPDKYIDYSSFDFIFISNQRHLDLIQDINVKKIFVAHAKNSTIGIHDKKFEGAIVGVSPYVCKSLNIENFIPNAIDLELFNVQPYVRKNSYIHGLFLTRYPEHYTDYVIDLFEKQGILLTFGGNDFNQREIVNKIHETDFVVGVGRSVYEGMACGKPTFISTGKTMCGWVTEENFQDLFEYNMTYSDIKVFNAQDVEEEIKKFEPNMGIVNRQLVEKHVSSETVCNQYLKLLNSL